MKHRIIYVDDDPNWAYTLPELGKLIGYDIISVQSADEFMEILARGEHMDLFISDIRLPKRDGYELIGEFRERHPEKPVFVITAYDTRKLKKFAQRERINKILLKPFSVSSLQGELESTLK